MNYTITSEYGHFVVRDVAGRFVLSADTYAEAEREMEDEVA